MSKLSNACTEGGNGMAVHSQAELDAAFADMDTLLADERPPAAGDCNVCSNCGTGYLSYSGQGAHPGSLVCDHCGVVQQTMVIWETMYGRDVPRKSSNYKRIHHWHERISQFLLQESEIPAEQMLLIARKLCDGSHSVLNKCSIRAVLRSLNMQMYIEKWLQIIYRITQVAPPFPGPMLLQQLDSMFIELQRPFNVSRPGDRKNFLNYNYVFSRLFQQIDCEQFSIFFPLIKSKQKLRVLDDTWESMLNLLSWEIKPLQYLAPFGVQLEQPELLLQRLGSQCALRVRAGPGTVPLRMVFQKSDRRREESRQRSLKRRHSIPPEPEFQKLGLLRRRLH